MAKQQTHTGWWIAFLVFQTVYGSFLTIDSAYSQRPFRASLFLLGGFAAAFLATRQIILALRSKDRSKHIPPIGSSS
jgi:hypothetical protein